MKLSEATDILSSRGIENARGEAREFFIRFGNFSRTDLIGCDPECNSAELLSAIERRSLREPLQYIIGSVCFYKEVYEVNPSCLIPRADTEILVETAIKNLPHGSSFLDLCTGSGCVAISTLKNTVDTRALALDISEEALETARINAKKNGVSDRIKFIQCDLTKYEDDSQYDAILSNPPYVTESEYASLSPEIYHEPRIAFVGGEDGLDFYRYIINELGKNLKENGFFAFEIGYMQGESIKKIANECGYFTEIIKDYGDNDRVALIKKHRLS